MLWNTQPELSCLIGEQYQQAPDSRTVEDSRRCIYSKLPLCLCVPAWTQLESYFTLIIFHKYCSSAEFHMESVHRALICKLKCKFGVCVRACEHRVRLPFCRWVKAALLEPRAQAQHSYYIFLTRKQHQITRGLMRNRGAMGGLSEQLK